MFLLQSDSSNYGGLDKTPLMKTPIQTPGKSPGFFKGGGRGHTVTNIIVMAFSPRNIVGCLLKKGLQMGGPLATPLNSSTVFALVSGKLRLRTLSSASQRCPLMGASTELSF